MHLVADGKRVLLRCMIGMDFSSLYRRYTLFADTRYWLR